MADTSQELWCFVKHRDGVFHTFERYCFDGPNQKEQGRKVWAQKLVGDPSRHVADEFVEVLLSKSAWRQRSNVLFGTGQVAIVYGIETRFEGIYVIDFFKRLALFKFDNRWQDVSILTDGVIV